MAFNAFHCIFIANNYMKTVILYMFKFLEKMVL